MWFLDTNKYVDFLTKHKITPNQFLFLYLTYTKDLKGNLYKYIEEVKGFTNEELKDLENRGYVRNLNKGGKSYCDMYAVEEKFYKEMFIATDHAGEELWDTYPTHFTLSGGTLCPARSCDKEKLIANYARKIKNNIKKHNEVIEILKTAIKRGDITMGIEKWVGSEQWNSLKEVKENKSNTTAI